MAVRGDYQTDESAGRNRGTSLRAAVIWLRDAVRAAPGQATAAPSLREAVADLGWTVDDGTHDAFLAELSTRLDTQPEADVAVITGAHPSGVHLAIISAYPAACVHVLDTGVTRSQLHVQLSAAGRFDVVVDDTRHGDQHIRILRDIFLHVRAGGVIVVRDYRSVPDSRRQQDTGETLLSHLAAVLDDRHTGFYGRSAARRDRVRLARSIGRVVVGDRHLALTNDVTAFAKLREDEANTLLGLRPDKGRVIESVPAEQVDARGCLLEGADRRDFRRPELIKAPAMYLREYTDVVCAPGQVVVSGNVLLPDTYRHNMYPRLSNRWSRELAPQFAQGPRAEDVTATLGGAYFWLDSEWRGHFGHVMTDQLPRMWAWARAKAERPDLKALLSLASAHTELPRWQVELFGAAGPDEADLVIITEPVRVERLLAATSMFSMPSYVHPGVTDVWDGIGRVLSPQARRGGYASRIFVSRRPGARRHCHNTAELEQYFADHGFEIVYPGEMSLADQIETFKRAQVIAGFTGSSLFNLMYCAEPKRVILLAPTSFTSSNEYLIAAVRGHQIDQIWSASDIEQPATGWSQQAYESNYTFDFDREGRVLDAVLAGLDDSSVPTPGAAGHDAPGRTPE